jgi:uncharacterized membrane protein
MAYFVSTPGNRSGYARGFVIFAVLAAVSLILILVMRHASAGRRDARRGEDP